MSRCNRHGREGCLCPDGAYTREEAQQRAGLCGPPPSVVHDRPALTARLTYLAVGLTDAGLSALVERAETLTVDHARPLTSGALAKSQQEREAATDTTTKRGPDRIALEWGQARADIEAEGRIPTPRALFALLEERAEAAAVPVEQAAPMAGKVCVPERSGL